MGCRHQPACRPENHKSLRLMHRPEVVSFSEALSNRLLVAASLLSAFFTQVQKSLVHHARAHQQIMRGFPRLSTFKHPLANSSFHYRAHFKRGPGAELNQESSPKHGKKSRKQTSHSPRQPSRWVIRVACLTPGCSKCLLPSDKKTARHHSRWCHAPHPVRAGLTSFSLPLD